MLILLKVKINEWKTALSQLWILNEPKMLILYTAHDEEGLFLQVCWLRLTLNTLATKQNFAEKTVSVWDFNEEIICHWDDENSHKEAGTALDNTMKITT